MKTDALYVAAIGACWPEQMSAAHAVEAGLYDADDFAESGLRSVLVAGDRPPTQLALSAARHALDRHGGDPSCVDLLIHSAVFFQGPEMWAPTGYILREIGAANVPAFEVRQGCNGMLAAIELARGQFASVPEHQTALLTTADNFNSPLLDRWHASGLGLVAGDAGTALVLTRHRGFARIDSVSSRVFPEIEAMQRGAEPLFPPTGSSGRTIDMKARAEYFGRTEMALTEAGEVIRKAHVEVVHRALAEADIDLADVRWLIGNNASRWTTERNFLDPLGLPMSKCTWDFGRTVGHVGASDHVLSLDHLLHTGQLAEGDHLVLVGGAPGWSAASVVLTIVDLPGWAAQPSSTTGASR